ncbi:MAG: oligosaccharide flippase family protein [bacterium]|nr:oligosaccharide flippase family protein [bacterium]
MISMLKRILKTSFYSVGSRGFLTLTNLIIMYSVSRILGDKSLGIYSITAFLYYLFSFFTSFELTTYFAKELAHKRDDQGESKKLFAELVTTFFIGLVTGFLILVCLLLFYKQIDAALMVVSAVSGVIFGIEKNLSGILLGREKMHYEFIAQLVAFLMVALPVFFLVGKLDIAGIYYLRIAASIVCIVLRGYFTKALKYLQNPPWFGTGPFFSGLYGRIRAYYNWKEIRFFSASGFSFFIQHHIDLFILSFMISKELEGAYFLALRIYLAFNLLAEMLSFALTPFISRSFRGKDPSRFNEFYSRMLLVKMALGVCASATLFFTRDILVSFFKSKGSPGMAADFLFYFSFLLFFRFVSYYTGNVLTSTRYHEKRFYILIISAALMILLEFVLGKFWSVYGIIYARAVTEIFIFVAYFVTLAKIKRHNHP